MNLPVGALQRRQIAGDVELGLLDALFDLVRSEVVVARVDGFELAAVDGDDRFREQAQFAAQHHKLRAGLLDRRPMILAEVGDGLVVGGQTLGEPHQLDIAPRFALQASAGRDCIEIAVNVELQ